MREVSTYVWSAFDWQNDENLKWQCRKHKMYVWLLLRRIDPTNHVYKPTDEKMHGSLHNPVHPFWSSRHAEVRYSNFVDKKNWKHSPHVHKELKQANTALLTNLTLKYSAAEQICVTAFPPWFGGSGSCRPLLQQARVIHIIVNVKFQPCTWGWILAQHLLYRTYIARLSTYPSAFTPAKSNQISVSVCLSVCLSVSLSLSLSVSLSVSLSLSLSLLEKACLCKRVKSSRSAQPVCCKRSCGAKTCRSRILQFSEGLWA